MNLKTNLWNKLLQYEFDTSKIHGQGYDGASNMRGEWNGLQALVIKECPYAYYVHCFVHRLQLALLAASREVIPIHQFFNKLSCIINVICASSKRHDELQKFKALEIKHLLELGEIKSGKGENQVGTLTRAVLEGIIDDSSSYSQRGDATEAYNYLMSFEFVFILNLMKEVMGKTCGRYRSRQKDNHVTFEHLYRVDIFICALDKQLHELANRFDNKATELLTLSSDLVPRKDSEVINIDQICPLVEKYYRADFDEQEMIRLRYQLELFNIEKINNQQLCGISIISELCRILVESKKCEAYGLIERLARLILTLLVSIATTERAFSAMKICKNRLRNKMSDDFLASNL
ncbi:uncharacterized protein [Rutidosis leptorrhynchoides]|uniref:uncharacterized protein n=1 Tax=Rutidosis leptorrhynchoides TaxID=125765 RepID=UPI003A9A1B62